MRIVFKQTILMKYHTLFVIFVKADFFNCRLLQNIDGALRVNLNQHFIWEEKSVRFISSLLNKSETFWGLF